jgi:hypothetical protein
VEHIALGIEDKLILLNFLSRRRTVAGGDLVLLPCKRFLRPPLWGRVGEEGGPSGVVAGPRTTTTPDFPLQGEIDR